LNIFSEHLHLETRGRRSTAVPCSGTCAVCGEWVCSACLVCVSTEKDVARTDRTHTFFQGDNNPNITVLYDILLTHCMYNFDLGQPPSCFAISVHIYCSCSDLLKRTLSLENIYILNFCTFLILFFENMYSLTCFIFGSNVWNSCGIYN